MGRSVVLILLPGMVFAQTYINKEWAQSTGQPDNITWQASTIDPFGDLIVVGNTQLTPGNSDVLVTKYNSIGELLWQQTFDGTAGANDYGVAVVTNSAGDVFVAATVHQTGNDLDFALLKYSSTGSLVWDATWNGPSDLADVPAGLFLDSLGNIYMHGASWAGPIFADHAFVKFSGAGAVVWHSMYDHAGLHDAAVGAEIVDGMLVSFGASATAMGEWAVALLTHDPATGAILDTLVSPLPGVGLHEASAWSMDQSGNFYVTGSYHDGIQHVIQTLKIGAGFGMIWLEDFDGNGLGAMGTAVAADEAGNVYVGGAMYNDQGGLEFITLKYDPYGELLWRQTHKPHNEQHFALVTKMVVHEEGIIVAGAVFDGTSLNFATLKYNEDGKLLWSKEHGAQQTSDKAMALALGQQGVIYVSGITGDLTNEWTYTTVKYDVYHKDNPAVLDSLGNPQYMANEVIVKFRPHLVDNAFVDSKDWQHGVLSDIVPDSVQLAIEDKFGLSPGYLSVSVR